MSKDVKRKNQKGFTLIELIVVIAILGVLAAVLIPQFGGLQHKGDSAQLRTDAKAIAVSLDAGIIDKTVTTDLAAAVPPVNNPVITLAGIPGGDGSRITSLQYTVSSGYFQLKEKVGSITYVATRTDKNSTIVFTEE